MWSMLTGCSDAEQRENSDPSDCQAKDRNTGWSAENAVLAFVVLVGNLRLIASFVVVEACGLNPGSTRLAEDLPVEFLTLG